MKREELWLFYVEKNPKFVEEGAEIRFTVKGVRQFFERTFDHAFAEGAKQEKEKNNTGNFNNSGFDIFSSMFTKK